MFARQSNPLKVFLTVLGVLTVGSTILDYEYSGPTLAGAEKQKFDQTIKTKFNAQNLQIVGMVEAPMKIRANDGKIGTYLLKNGADGSFKTEKALLSKNGSFHTEVVETAVPGPSPKL